MNRPTIDSGELKVVASQAQAARGSHRGTDSIHRRHRHDYDNGSNRQHQRYSGTQRIKLAHRRRLCGRFVLLGVAPACAGPALSAIVVAGHHIPTMRQSASRPSISIGTSATNATSAKPAETAK